MLQLSFGTTSIARWLALRVWLPPPACLVQGVLEPRLLASVPALFVGTVLKLKAWMDIALTAAYVGLLQSTGSPPYQAP